eukprot:GHVP01031614.1.p1 GENE.GHVP01031614.1~~GHVP01031614.1.p1  ORF type:complete len:871 (-),score=167.49 GHVP01031614.1:555-3167(-)
MNENFHYEKKEQKTSNSINPKRKVDPQNTYFTGSMVAMCGENYEIKVFLCDSEGYDIFSTIERPKVYVKAPEIPYLASFAVAKFDTNFLEVESEIIQEFRGDSFLKQKMSESIPPDALESVDGSPFIMNLRFKHPGLNEVHVEVGGLPIQGSPLTVEVADFYSKASSCKLSENFSLCKAGISKTSLHNFFLKQSVKGINCPPVPFEEPGVNKFIVEFFDTNGIPAKTNKGAISFYSNDCFLVHLKQISNSKFEIIYKFEFEISEKFEEVNPKIDILVDGERIEGFPVALEIENMREIENFLQSVPTGVRIARTTLRKLLYDMKFKEAGDFILQMEIASNPKETDSTGSIATPKILLEQLRDESEKILREYEVNYFKEKEATTKLREAFENLSSRREELREKLARIKEESCSRLMEATNKFSALSLSGSSIQEMLAVQLVIADELHNVGWPTLGERVSKLCLAAIEEVELNELEYQISVKESKIFDIEEQLLTLERNLGFVESNSEATEKYLNKTYDPKQKTSIMEEHQFAKKLLNMKKKKTQTLSASMALDTKIGNLIARRARINKSLEYEPSFFKPDRTNIGTAHPDEAIYIEKILSSSPRLKDCLKSIFTFYAGESLSGIEGISKYGWLRFCKDVLRNANLRLEMVMDFFCMYSDIVKENQQTRLLLFVSWLNCVREFGHAYFCSLTKDRTYTHPSRMQTFFAFCVWNILPLYTRIILNDPSLKRKSRSLETKDYYSGGFQSLVARFALNKTKRKDLEQMWKECRKEDGNWSTMHEIEICMRRKGVVPTYLSVQDLHKICMLVSASNKRFESACNPTTLLNFDDFEEILTIAMIKHVKEKGNLFGSGSNLDWTFLSLGEFHWLDEIEK